MDLDTLEYDASKYMIVHQRNIVLASYICLLSLSALIKIVGVELGLIGCKSYVISNLACYMTFYNK